MSRPYSILRTQGGGGEKREYRCEKGLECPHYIRTDQDPTLNPRRCPTHQRPMTRPVNP